MGKNRQLVNLKASNRFCFDEDFLSLIVTKLTSNPFRTFKGIQTELKQYNNELIFIWCGKDLWFVD